MIFPYFEGFLNFLQFQLKTSTKTDHDCDPWVIPVLLTPLTPLGAVQQWFERSEPKKSHCAKVQIIPKSSVVELYHNILNFHWVRPFNKDENVKIYAPTFFKLVCRLALLCCCQSNGTVLFQQYSRSFQWSNSQFYLKTTKNN